MKKSLLLLTAACIFLSLTACSMDMFQKHMPDGGNNFTSADIGKVERINEKEMLVYVKANSASADKFTIKVDNDSGYCFTEVQKTGETQDGYYQYNCVLNNQLDLGRNCTVGYGNAYCRYNGESYTVYVDTDGDGIPDTPAGNAWCCR